MKHPVAEMLEKFKEGEKLYSTSPLFTKCVDMLVYGGGDIYHLLEEIIHMNEEQIKVTEDIIKRSSVPITFIIPKIRD